MNPPSVGECETALTLRPGESRPCVGTSLPPQAAAHYLADRRWLETSLILAEADNADLSDENIRLATENTALRDTGCYAKCQVTLLGVGVGVGAGAVVGVLYAVAPAFGR